MPIHIDASQVDRLAIDLQRADQRMPKAARAVIKRGALEIKKGMQKDFSGHSHAGGVPFSLEFNMTGSNAYVARAEIGELDSAGRQWGIAAILAYGTSNNAPVVDHTAALRREVPQIMHHLGDAAEDSVLRGAE